MSIILSQRQRVLTPADILPLAEYAAIRGDERRRIGELKRRRRLEVGPYAAFYFENFATIRHQVQEMLHIEKGGAAQLEDELTAYNPLIPQGHELIATIMFEIDDPARRAASLVRLGGIETHVFLDVAGERICGVPDPNRENTTAEGKASSVQFITFPFSTEQIARFKTPQTRILAGFDHPNYGHITIMPEMVRAALAEDFA
jgi:catechol 2,3-dioxygenase-like lactoylglutathione lyase family enzyme